MRSELLNLSLFVSAIAKFLLMTGIGLGGAVALGFEKVSRKHLRVSRKVWAGQLAHGLSFVPANNFNRATSPARKARFAGVAQWRAARFPTRRRMLRRMPPAPRSRQEPA